MSLLHSLDYYHWLLLGVMLMVVELLLGGGFLVWLGFAAFITGVLVLVLPWIDIVLAWQWQLVMFIALSVLAVGCWWKYFHWLHPDEQANRLLGTEICLQKSMKHGEGHLEINGIDWPISGPDLPAGTRVQLVAWKKRHFVVEAIAP